MFVKNDYTPSAVAFRIKNVLKSKKMTQKEMFTALNMAVNTLDNYKKSMPKSDNLALIADYLDCSVDYLLGRSDNPNISPSYSNNNISHSSNIAFGENSSVGCSEDEIEKEVCSILSSLNLRERSELLTMIYKFVDEHKGKE